MYQDNLDKMPVQLKNIDWRSNMEITPEILVSSDELITPVDDIWEEYKYSINSSDSIRND
jgi:hypothetical protein